MRNPNGIRATYATWRDDNDDDERMKVHDQNRSCDDFLYRLVGWFVRLSLN